MADWSLLGNFLEEVQEHSTSVGKVWLTVLFIFRILVLGTAAESSWGDEQEDFNCDTEQPGCCRSVFVSTPSLIYMGHAMHTVRMEEKRRRGGGDGGGEKHGRKGEKDRGKEESRDGQAAGRVRLRGALLQTYVLSILLRSVMEVVFLLLQYFMYGVFLNPLYVCKAWPCPHPVNCYVSRPTEKNVFIVFMMTVSAVSLLLSVLELHHLAWRHCCRYARSPRHFSRAKAVTLANASLARQLSVPPPLPPTPPPDFNQCVMGSSHFLPLPFPNHRLADQQNSDNMAAEKNKMAAAAAEEVTLLQMSRYSPAWPAAGGGQIQDGGYLRTGDGETGGGHRDRRRFSRTSGTSSRTRADDLSV
uniref:Gap junction protein n=1 Tax=Gasterosteus aculeatus aculeatus TaxID=481459 RepID=A0AAQ4RRK6_GASAC